MGSAGKKGKKEGKGKKKKKRKGKYKEKNHGALCLLAKQRKSKQHGARQLEGKDGTLGRGKKDDICWIWQERRRTGRRCPSASDPAGSYPQINASKSENKSNSHEV